MNQNPKIQYFYNPSLGMKFERPSGATDFQMDKFGIETYMFEACPNVWLERLTPGSYSLPSLYRFEHGYATLLWRSYLRVTRTLTSIQ